MIHIDKEIQEKIYNLYDECLNNLGQFHRKLDLFIVPSELAQKIEKVTNIDVSGHWVCIDNFGIIHNMETQFQRQKGGRLQSKEQIL